MGTYILHTYCTYDTYLKKLLPIKRERKKEENKKLGILGMGMFFEPHFYICIFVSWIPFFPLFLG